MRRPPRACSSGILLLCGLVLEAHPVSADLIDRVLAIVDAQVVTLSDANVALALGIAKPAGADPVAAAMSTLIDRRLVLIEVDRYALPEPDDSTVAARADGLRAQLAGRVPGNRPLAQLTLSDQRLREIARDDVRIEVYLAQRFGVVQPTEADVARYYREHVELFTREGAPLPFVEVQADARQRLAAELRQALIDQWIADLRRRADIHVLYRPATPEAGDLRSGVRDPTSEIWSLKAEVGSRSGSAREARQSESPRPRACRCSLTRRSPGT